MRLPMTLLRGLLSLGCIDAVCLFQQTLIKLLVENVRRQGAVCGADGRFEDITQWKYLVFNEAHEVVEIQWEWLRLGGIIGWYWIIRSLQILNFEGNKLEGSVPLIDLPNRLKQFRRIGLMAPWIRHVCHHH